VSVVAYPMEAAQAAPPAAPEPWTWVERFVLLQLLCQLALLLPGLGAGRLVVRLAALGSSLVLLAVIRGRRGFHPSARAGLAVVAVLFVCVFHPDTPSLFGGAAHAGLYIALLGPLFWVPRLRVTSTSLKRAVTILWIFHTLSAAFGVLQVYFPGQFQPGLSSIVLSKGEGYIESLKIVTSTGAKVFRPMGLTDIPGGAGISGLYAVLFGIGFFLTRRRATMIAASITSMGLGMVVLYLAQVRALVVMTGIAVIVIAGMLAWRRDMGRLAGLAGTVALVVLAGWGVASSLAGATVARRMGSLVRERPGAVYYSERGHFLKDAVTRQLPEAPFGSGLGRWGMTASYFPYKPVPGARPVWVEIQWAAWIVDGGVPLTLAYVAALGMALLSAWRIARRRGTPADPDLPFWATIVFAHGVGAAALTFSYPIFVSQTGLEFWLLNAAVFAASRQAQSEVQR
jgi:hypothetical protein